MIKKRLVHAICLFIPLSCWRKSLRNRMLPQRPVPPTAPQPFRESQLVHRYLDGLNGIEIGASRQNSFGLDQTGGAYATVDLDPEQGQNWQDPAFTAVHVNIAASGDNLPFKDQTLDYVLSSHVIEHFFDPIQTLCEWNRVIRKGGYVIAIVPHKDRTFDAPREITAFDELQLRHSGQLTIQDYAYPDPSMPRIPDLSEKGTMPSDLEHLYIGKAAPPPGWKRFEHDDHHHWCVWRTSDFLTLCQQSGFTIVEYQDPDDKVGNGFTVVMTKP